MNQSFQVKKPSKGLTPEDRQKQIAHLREASRWAVGGVLLALIKQVWLGLLLLLGVGVVTGSYTGQSLFALLLFHGFPAASVTMACGVGWATLVALCFESTIQEHNKHAEEAEQKGK